MSENNGVTEIAKIRGQASEALRKAAIDEKAKSYLLDNPILFNLLLKAARRYIGGETLEQALETRKILHMQGFQTSMEFMGENVTTVAEAREATHEFLRVIKALQVKNKADRISLDLSHLGLVLDHKLGMENFRALAEASKNTSIELFISAEGLERTDEVLDAYFQFSREFSHVNITLQAYLHRTPKDLERILKESQGKVRMTKGAFEGPKELFLPRGLELNDRYIEMINTLFEAKRYCSIATHDPKIIDRIIPILAKSHIPSSMYEFEMLYGIGTSELNDLKNRGYPCRRYVVYGKEWYLYLCNRIAENPENVFQAIVDIMT
jgi:proline dehydrogenase